MGAPCLVALDVSVLAFRRRWVPGDLQLAGRQRVHPDVLGGHGWGWGESRTGGAEGSAHTCGPLRLRRCPGPPALTPGTPQTLPRTLF